MKTKRLLRDCRTRKEVAAWVLKSQQKKFRLLLQAYRCMADKAESTTKTKVLCGQLVNAVNNEKAINDLLRFKLNSLRAAYRSMKRVYLQNQWKIEPVLAREITEDKSERTVH